MAGRGPARLGLLSGGGQVRSWTMLARHTSRSSDLVASDRYNTIRKFFTHAHASQSPARYTLFPDGSRARSEVTYLLQRGQAPKPLVLTRTRPLHTTTIWRNNDAHKSHPRLTSQRNVHPDQQAEQSSSEPSPRPPDPPPHLENYSDFFRRLALSLPHLHRPTRDDFLNVTSGFWQRARVRFKWFTIRSFRRFNADDISAFISLLLLSQTVWILVGTTTFFSMIFATANSLRLQEYIARALSDYLTAETGVTVVFESAIVPKWKDSRISFKNVYVSRGFATTSRSSSRSSPARHHAVGYDVNDHPIHHGIAEEDHDEVTVSHAEEDENYAMFDMTVGSIDVTLSLWRWLDGKGLVQDAEIKGVRGVLDRSHIHYDPDQPLDPASFRRTAHPGDFDLEALKLDDVLITVHQPGDFRPFTFSIFRAELGPVRKQWLFLDFLSAEGIVGQFDGSLFSLHRPQSMGRTNERDVKDTPWTRMTRFRVDGVNIDHLQAMTTYEGPISWITSGKIDAVLDFKLPHDPEDGADALNALLGEIAEAISTAVEDRIPGQRELAKPPLTVPEDDAHEEGTETGAGAAEKRVVVDIDLRFKDLKAAVPMFTNDLSYTGNALIRPIVAFMNANHTLVPIRCRAVRDLDDFNGSWTLWETGLSDEIALKTYEAMAHHVLQANFNRRIMTVSWWSLNKMVGAVLVTLRTMADPVRAHLKEVYANVDDVAEVVQGMPLYA